MSQNRVIRLPSIDSNSIIYRYVKLGGTGRRRPVLTTYKLRGLYVYYVMYSCCYMNEDERRMRNGMIPSCECSCSCLPDDGRGRKRLTPFAMHMEHVPFPRRHRPSPIAAPPPGESVLTHYYLHTITCTVRGDGTARLTPASQWGDGQYYPPQTTVRYSNGAFIRAHELCRYIRRYLDKDIAE